MDIFKIRSWIVRLVKKVSRVDNLTLFVRKRIRSVQKLLYHDTYTVDDIIDVLNRAGIKPGYPIIVHASYGNLYNYEGTADELIDKLIEFVGPEGTVCMPAYPKDKFDSTKVFDVNHSESAAGYLSEVFRKRPDARRSLNQLHSVCAIGKDADFIVGEHHLSRISYDKHSPFYKIAELGGYSVSLGLPKWYIGTGGHICEALLYGRSRFFTAKFSIEKEFTYIDDQHNIFKHKMFTCSDKDYVRSKSTRLIDKNFEKQYYSRDRLSNIWINTFNMRYLYKRLEELAIEGKTIYKHPRIGQHDMV